MQLKPSLMLSLAANFVFMSLLLWSCGSGPKVTIYVSDPQMSGFDGFDELTQKTLFLPYSESDKFVCFNPTDAQTLLNYCQSPKK